METIRKIRLALRKGVSIREASEMAATVIWLYSPMSTWVIGQSITVDTVYGTLKFQQDRIRHAPMGMAAVFLRNPNYVTGGPL